MSRQWPGGLTDNFSIHPSNRSEGIARQRPQCCPATAFFYAKPTSPGCLNQPPARSPVKEKVNQATMVFGLKVRIAPYKRPPFAERGPTRSLYKTNSSGYEEIKAQKCRDHCGVVQTSDDDVSTSRPSAPSTPLSRIILLLYSLRYSLL
ncbi:hypothetical protein DFH08DRAFT_809916 [Mycena albidolilacea]|uniref:Uncharacterized protein n=1 Tax=Mycena albidolilacea TaxID=1033008 RepID=A0AAD6ZYJ4_9AGAR|nr:hypothetical protein DFH08DRAFT_809916 [Mycena albidolilacea]